MSFVRGTYSLLTWLARVIAHRALKSFRPSGHFIFFFCTFSRARMYTQLLPMLCCLAFSKNTTAQPFKMRCYVQPFLYLLLLDLWHAHPLLCVCMCVCGLYLLKWRDVGVWIVGVWTCINDSLSAVLSQVEYHSPPIHKHSAGQIIRSSLVLLIQAQPSFCNIYCCIRLFYFIKLDS